MVAVSGGVATCETLPYSREAARDRFVPEHTMWRKLLYSGFDTFFGTQVAGIRYQNTSQIQILPHFKKRGSDEFENAYRGLNSWHDMHIRDANSTTHTTLSRSTNSSNPSPNSGMGAGATGAHPASRAAPASSTKHSTARPRGILLCVRVWAHGVVAPAFWPVIGLMLCRRGSRASCAASALRNDT